MFSLIKAILAHDLESRWIGYCKYDLKLLLVYMQKDAVPTQLKKNLFCVGYEKGVGGLSIILILRALIYFKDATVLYLSIIKISC